MNLKNLTSLLKSGNVALGQKLQNLLTEDCSIVEYTDDAVLFQKDKYLVLAKFNHDLSEAKLTSDSIIDNEVISISGKRTERDLKEAIISIVDNLVEGNLVDSEDQLSAFCEQYFHYHVIKSKFPELFTENLNKRPKGTKLRKKAIAEVTTFKSDVFSALSMKEGQELDVHEITAILESSGSVLLLGKDKVKSLISDAVFGNVTVAEQVTDRLYLVATSLNEANEDLAGALAAGYDLESGKFADEDSAELETEDLTAGDDIDTDFPEDEFDESLEDGPDEFAEFDPSKLSEEDLQELHKTVLVSVLKGIAEFVSREANNPENSEVMGDLDQQLVSDLETLGNEDISAEELSQIEARWHPMIASFLDSDMYTPEQDLGDEEVTVSELEPEGEPIEDVESDFEGEEGSEGQELGETEEEPFNAGAGNAPQQLMR